MSQEHALPKLSVVVISFNSPLLLERCLSALERQTLNDGVETLVVRQRDANLDEHENLERRFQYVRWICAPRGSNVPQMRSLGICGSQGDVIALLEDDCVPTENWYEELLRVHQESDAAAIAGAIEPGEYTKGLDWAIYFHEYSHFMQPLPDGEAQTLPGTNVSYKRMALRQLIDANEFNNDEPKLKGHYEAFVHQKLQQSDQALKLDPNLVVHNLNSWTYSRVLRIPFHHGRNFAGIRVAERPYWRHLPFLALAVLLPFVQIGRIVRNVIVRRRHAWSLGQALPWIILFSISWSMGEFVGYLLGSGKGLQY